MFNYLTKCCKKNSNIYKHIQKNTYCTLASGVSLILSLFTVKTIPSGPVTEYSLTLCSSKCFIDTTDCLPGKKCDLWIYFTHFSCFAVSVQKVKTDTGRFTLSQLLTDSGTQKQNGMAGF